MRALRARCTLRRRKVQRIYVYSARAMARAQGIYVLVFHYPTGTLVLCPALMLLLLMVHAMITGVH